MKGIRLTSEDLAKHIRDAGDTCLLITPGVDAVVADALRERLEHGATKASVVIDGSHHAERSGYGTTGTWRDLRESTELRAMPGTRLGLLVTDCGAWIFAPRAGKLDPREDVGLSAVMLEAHQEAARALSERILGRLNKFPQTDVGTRERQHEILPSDQVHGEDEPRARDEPITEKDVAQAEKAIEEHPPRDYAKERATTVYTAFVGYIEMRLVGASLGKGARLKVPEELVERGLGENELRQRINESVKIDLEEEADTGVREINERLNAIRALYTRQLGEPHGRIYRKRQRQELEDHLRDLKWEIAQANSTLGEKFDAALRKQLDDLAETYSRQTVRATLPELTKEEMSQLLLKAWHEAGAARRREVKLEVTFKDLTWETLQDDALRERIVQQFPELERSTLYREYQAHAPEEGT